MLFLVNKHVYLTRGDFDDSILSRNSISLKIWDDDSICTKGIASFLDNCPAIEVFSTLQVKNFENLLRLDQRLEESLHTSLRSSDFGKIQMVTQ